MSRSPSLSASRRGGKPSPRRLGIVVLSRADSVHSTRRLVEAAELLGHEVTVVDPVSLQLQLGPTCPDFQRSRPHCAVIYNKSRLTLRCDVSGF